MEAKHCLGFLESCVLQKYASVGAGGGLSHGVGSGESGFISLRPPKQVGPLADPRVEGALGHPFGN